MYLRVGDIAFGPGSCVILSALSFDETLRRSQARSSPRLRSASWTPLPLRHAFFTIGVTYVPYASFSESIASRILGANSSNAGFPESTNFLKRCGPLYVMISSERPNNVQYLFIWSATTWLVTGFRTSGYLLYRSMINKYWRSSLSNRSEAMHCQGRYGSLCSING